jgi:hypothetical protein
MKKLFSFLFILLSISTFAQDQKEFSYKLSGFVKSDYWIDSRQVNHAREGLFLFTPTDIKLDKNGNDINEGWNINFSAITTRLILDLKSKDAFGAKSSGYIEADFSGASNVATNNFRLRHAYFKLDWAKSQLLMGQTWNPTFTTDCFPSILSLNTGAPFQPFIRNPQITFTRHLTSHLDILASALTQRDNANISKTDGITRDYSYLSNTGLPNFHVQLKFKKNKHYAGLGADYKWLRPRLSTDSNIKTTEKFGSYSFLGYYRYKNDKWDYKIKAMYGQNINENLMLGGYALHSYDSLTGFEKYTPTNHFFMWTNLTRTFITKKLEIKPSFFIGFLKNLGTSESILGAKYFYAMGSTIDKMYRISPSVNIKSGNVMFALEYELTNASYGTPDMKGVIRNTHNVNNHRILFTGFYFF